MYVRTDRSLIPSCRPSRRGIVVDLTAPTAVAQRSRPPLNLAIVLDRSGSMGGAKIRLAKEAAARALRLLSPTDRFALVVYDDRVDVLVESTPATSEARQNALSRLAAVEARGSTDLAGGWLRGCEQVARHLAPDTLGRCLLLTDGLANAGLTDPAEIVGHAGALRQRGVVTSTFGVGADFDEKLLQDMSSAGAGHAFYVEQAVQIPDFLASEIGETLAIVARDVRLEVTLPPRTRTELLSLFANAPGDGRLVCELGDLASGDEVCVVLAAEFPPGDAGETFRLEFRLSDREGCLASHFAQLTWTRVPDAEDERQPVDRAVVARLAEHAAQLAIRAALARHDKGDYNGAQKILHAAAHDLRAEFPGDPDVEQAVRDLLERGHRISAVLEASEKKQMRYASYQSLRSRKGDGTSRRPDGGVE